jgi:hypothetical protein
MTSEQILFPNFIIRRPTMDDCEQLCALQTVTSKKWIKK